MTLFFGVLALSELKENLCQKCYGSSHFVTKIVLFVCAAKVLVTWTTGSYQSVLSHLLSMDVSGRC